MADAVRVSTDPPSIPRYKRSSVRADNKRRRTHAHNNNNTRIEAVRFVPLSLARHPIEIQSNATGRLTTTKVWIVKKKKKEIMYKLN